MTGNGWRAAWERERDARLDAEARLSGQRPEYGARHRHHPEHWATGPAAAIAAAETMITTLAAERHGATR